VSQKPSKTRLDVLLVGLGLIESREQARRYVMAGEVTVNGQLVIKPSTKVSSDAAIELKAKPRFVSRGGEKLAAALEAFPINLTGKICADIGASTGGFTDCMLQNGARKVYAIDVGYGQLAWQLRQDERVIVMERINARYLDSLPELVDFGATDVSFISLRHIFPTMARLLNGRGQAVALVKPQFEAGRADVGKGGVVKDPEIHRRVLYVAVGYAQDHDFTISGLMPSPLEGPAGNIEFLLWLTQKPTTDPVDVDVAIRDAIAAVHGDLS